MADLTAIQHWVFDLDDTIYSPDLRLFQQVKTRILAYLAQHYCQGSSHAALAMQKDLRTRHATTLAGLMAEQQVNPQHFMDYVHDIDLGGLGYDKAIDGGLSRLPGRKLIFTNASTKHAQRILTAVGIDHHFDFTYDIVAAGYRPKPDAAMYGDFIAAARITPATAVMIDDMAINLMPAADMGMRTLWLDGGRLAKNGDAKPVYVHHTAPDLKHFLTHMQEALA